MITSIADIQKHVQIATSTPWGNIRPDVEMAELFVEKYIEPTLIAQMKIVMAAPTPPQQWVDLDNIYSRLVANWAMYNYIPKTYINVSNAGVRVSTTETTERAPMWAVRDAQKSYFDVAYAALETMLQYSYKYCMISGQPFFTYVSDAYRSQFTGIFSDTLQFNSSSYLKTNYFTYLRISHSFSEAIDTQLRPQFGVYLDTFIPKANKNQAEGTLMVYMRKVVAAEAFRRGLNALVLSYDNAGIRALPLESNDVIEGIAMTQEQKMGLRHELDANISNYLTQIKQHVSINYANLPGITNTPIYIAVSATDGMKRYDYDNANSKGSFFM